MFILRWRDVSGVSHSIVYLQTYWSFVTLQSKALLTLDEIRTDIYTNKRQASSRSGISQKGASTLVHQHTIWLIFPKNYMKTMTFWRKGSVSLMPPRSTTVNGTRPDLPRPTSPPVFLLCPYWSFQTCWSFWTSPNKGGVADHSRAALTREELLIILDQSLPEEDFLIIL